MRKLLPLAVTVIISSAAYAQQPPDLFTQKMRQVFDTLGIGGARFYKIPTEGKKDQKYILIETDTTHYINDTLAVKVYNIISDSAKIFDHISIIHNRPNGQPLVISYFMNNRLFVRKK